MTFKDFMYKGVLMIAVLALIGWLGKYLYLVDGEIDWFRLMLVYGVPVGIPHMFFMVPWHWDLSGILGMMTLCVIVGSLFVSAKYCYVTHELRLHQNDRCKRFTPV